ncbi:hypothetical protein J7E79_12465 [Bacillus sp. ISL-40]|uniref:hypothetical protein n=1 Tax=unclassified Bacillus (in: firmicutes) TaxID=185979 RepID=UPI001BE6D352|nr:MULTISPECIES: hypothetical protein [unclassified Bacillus (in: firmicutes)]MBT2698228.1 hypothetical protein [Bacillus sp. ISL-40]MBT2741949.1 hypothetical protein [Bacillus sp. ISL-77]
MLTTAQQKVKQELEELQINALVYHNEKTIIPRKSHSLKKWMFMIISILLLIVACSLLIKGYWTHKGFEKEKIKYILRENGTIQYWIKSKSYDVGK